MWDTLRMSAETNPDFVSSAMDLLRSTSRNLIFVIGGAYTVCLLATTFWTEQFATIVWLVAPILALTWLAAYGLLSRHFLTAQIIWHVGLAGAITLAVYLSQMTEIAFAYALLPLMAVFTVGWPAGLLAEGLVIVLVWGLLGHLMVQPIAATHAIAITVGGAVTGLLGWASARTFLTVTEWSFSGYELARKQADRVLEQRVELVQTQQDLVQANQELARLSDRLKAMHLVAEQARYAKEEFVANVSHELRTPLNMIIGFSEMITESPQVYGVGLPPPLLADIAAIQRNSQHLAKLVNDVLDLSQVEAGRMALSKEWTCLPEIIDEAALTVQALFESKGLYLKIDNIQDLPPIFCDSTRIRQVMINLLSNAGRFTERGGVRIAAWRENNDVVISVADTGPGIAPALQEKVFEPFQQVDSSIHRRYGGSGLGLSISKQFVEMHGGKMWLESPAPLLAPSTAAERPTRTGGTGAGKTGELGVGTAIYFSLPLQISSPALAADNVTRWFSPYDEYEYRMRTRRSKAPAPAVMPRFVVLEEGNTLRQLLARHLGDVELVSVQDIEGAAAELNHLPAQALLINAAPFESPPVPSDRLANLPYGTPAITCWVPGEDEAAKRLGVVRYLVKPVTREALFSTIASLGESVKNVLLVDDNPEALQLFARMLASAEKDYHILQATSGQRALNLLRTRQPDVMLLDLMMPGMDGFQVVREKAQDPSIRDIAVVVISAADPAGKPLTSNTLTVTRGEGLSAFELVTCIHQVSETLSPSVRPDRARSETPVAKAVSG
jgi:signal transduction histidine kinase/CheY-like chemotaxis protein